MSSEAAEASKLAVNYLRRPYALEGWRDVPYALRNTETGAICPLSQREFTALRSLGGRQGADDPTALARLILQGFITSDPKLAASTDFHQHDYLQRNVVQLSVTDLCNFRCKHCLATEGAFGRRGQLELPAIERLFSDMEEMGIPSVEFTGGEPLLRPDLRDIILRANAHGLRIRRIYTNGTKLNRSLLEYLESLNQHPTLFISFDGLGTHDWMRNCEGAEAAALDAMDLARSCGFRVCASINVNAITAPTIEDTARHLACERRVSALHLIQTGPTPAWDIALKEVPDFSCEDFFELMVHLIDVSRTEGWPALLDIHHMPALHNGAPRGFLRRIADRGHAQGDERTFTTCPKARSMVFVASDGRVLPCSAFEGPSLVWHVMDDSDTNIRDRSLRDILSSSGYTRCFEETIADMLKVTDRCRDCEWLALCRGGCPLFRLAEPYQAPIGQSCRLFKSGYFEKYLKVIGVNLDDYRGCESDGRCAS